MEVRHTLLVLLWSRAPSAMAPWANIIWLQIQFYQEAVQGSLPLPRLKGRGADSMHHHCNGGVIFRPSCHSVMHFQEFERVWLRVWILHVGHSWWMKESSPLTQKDYTLKINKNKWPDLFMFMKHIRFNITHEDMLIFYMKKNLEAWHKIFSDA